MKRVLLLLAAGSLALMAAQPPTGVVGSMHDLSKTNTTAFTTAVTDYAQVCKFCHSPHGAAPASAQVVPLWGHKTTAATYTMYTSETMAAAGYVADAAPSGPSAACLSCHDGTVAVNARMAGGYSYSYGNVTTTSTDFSIVAENSGKAQMGYLTNHVVGVKTGSNVDMTTVHPIGVAYNATDVANFFAAPKTAGMLFNNKVQCASCHDVHNWQGPAGTTSGLFLRVTTDGSALCLQCHNK